MPCISFPSFLVLLALADAVGYGVEVSRHHVQFVGLELPTRPWTKNVLVTVVEFEYDLLMALASIVLPPMSSGLPLQCLSFSSNASPLFGVHTCLTGEY